MDGVRPSGWFSLPDSRRWIKHIEVWSPKAIHRLHRIGYAATLIVALEIGTVGWFAGSAWWRFRRIEAAQREDTRTHAGPITARDGDPVRGDALQLLAKLPSLASLGPDAARYAVAPSFGREWFAVALCPGTDRARGVLVTVERSGMDTLGVENRRAFSMPVQAYRALTARADRLTDGWVGTTHFWTDGTPIAFERVRGGALNSGIGNEPTHYGGLAAAVRDGLAPYVPEVASLDGEWMQRERGRSR